MQIITTEIAVERFKKSLSLNEHNDDEDMIALGILKNASFLLPMKRSEFTKNILKLFSPMIEEGLTKESINDYILDHINHGNLVEEKNQEDKKELYVSPPSFIETENKFLILGFPRNNQKILSDELSHKIEIRKHHRYINCTDKDEQEFIRGELLNSKLNEIKEDQYKKVPRSFIKERSQDHLDFIRKRLKPPDGDDFNLSNVEKLNTEKSVNYYSGRWDEIDKKTSGEFIIRWGDEYDRHYAFAEIESSFAKKIVMFPLQYSSESDRQRLSDIDQVLYTQLALDALHRKNQEFKISNVNGKTLLSFFHRLPKWIIREVELIANKTEPMEAALMTYELLDSNTTVIKDILEQYWLRKQSNEV